MTMTKTSLTLIVTPAAWIVLLGLVSTDPFHCMAFVPNLVRPQKIVIDVGIARVGQPPLSLLDMTTMEEDSTDGDDDDDDDNSEDGDAGDSPTETTVVAVEMGVDMPAESKVEVVAAAMTEEATTTIDKTTTTTITTTASDKSWSDILSEAADVAVLLGGAAAKAASEAVGDMKTVEFPIVDVGNVTPPRSLQEVADKAISLGEVAAKVASSAIGGITTATAAASKLGKADVSIPYDSAARSAYKEWLIQYGSKVKRPNDGDDDEQAYSAEERFQFFQERYNNVTVHNVRTKKLLREQPPVAVEEEGTNATSVVPQLVTLDQYADLSPEEYTKVMKSLEPKSWGDILGEIATLAGTAAATSVNKISNTVGQDKSKLATKKSAPAPTSPLNFLSSTSKAKASPTKIKKKTVAPAPSPAPAPSFFGGLLSSPSKTTKPSPKTTKKKMPARVSSSTKTPSRPTLSIFSPKPKVVEAKPTKASEVPIRSITSIFGSPKTSSGTKTANKKAAPGIPSLSNWVQNKDGSITGKVSNSPNFRSGTKITTSPVRWGAKKGSVVKTGSGSQYKLN